MEMLSEKELNFSKKELREHMSALESGDSAAVVQKLLQRKEIQDAKAVMVYAALQGEVSIAALIKQLREQGKTIAYPRIEEARMVACEAEEHDLVDHVYGVQQPHKDCQEVGNIDVVLVPGVCFDAKRNRLGRGKGYYDKFLHNFTGHKIGVSFDNRVIESIPVEEHDERMDLVITEKGMVGVENDP